MTKNTVSFELKHDEIAEMMNHSKEGESLNDLAYRLLIAYLNQLKFTSPDEQNLAAMDARLKKIELMVFNIGNRIPFSLD